MKVDTDRLELVVCDQQSFERYSDKYPMGPHVDMYLEKLTENSKEEGLGVWFIVLKDNGVVVGDIGFKGRPDHEDKVEIGYGVTPEYQGNGYASEAAEGILNWAFENAKVKRIIAECLIDNKASIRVLEKVGFKQTNLEGEMLKWVVWSAGRTNQ